MSEIVDGLQGIDGADARIIAQLGGLDFQVEYIREDLKSRYSDEDLSDAHQLIMANQISGDDFKDFIGKDFEAQILFFEDIVVFVLPSSRYEAVFASFDRHDALPINSILRIATAR